MRRRATPQQSIRRDVGTPRSDFEYPPLTADVLATPLGLVTVGLGRRFAQIGPKNTCRQRRQDDG